MSGLTGGNRGLWRAGALAVVAGVAVLTNGPAARADDACEHLLPGRLEAGS